MYQKEYKGKGYRDSTYKVYPTEKIWWEKFDKTPKSARVRKDRADRARARGGAAFIDFALGLRPESWYSFIEDDLGIAVDRMNALAPDRRPKRPVGGMDVLMSWYKGLTEEQFGAIEEHWKSGKSIVSGYETLELERKRQTQDNKELRENYRFNIPERNPVFDAPETPVPFTMPWSGQ